MTAAGHDPRLTEDEIIMLVRRARRVDSADRFVDAEGYVFTCDLMWAAMRGWEIKAGRCAEVVPGSIGGGGFSFDQLFKHCQEQADRYRRGVNYTLRVPGPPYGRFDY